MREVDVCIPHECGHTTSLFQVYRTGMSPQNAENVSSLTVPVAAASYSQSGFWAARPPAVPRRLGRWK